MNFKSIACICLIGLITLSCKQQKALAQTTNQGLQKTNLFPKGEKMPNDNFTGVVYAKVIVEADSINPTSVGNVTFEPGARSYWHMHQGGQILLAIDGVGYYQEKGQTKKILRKGDVVKCPPNVPHWHGASVDTAFVQVAITNRHLGATVWLEKVTDDEYNK